MKQTVQLSALSAANIGLVFLFQWYVLIKLGSGIETDALFAGMTLPQLVLVVISGSLMHVVVPLLAGEDEDRLRHDAWGLLVLIGGVFGLLAAVLYMTASWWIPIMVPGFSDEGKDLTVELTRIQLVGMVFTAANSVQWAAYHARQKFLWAEVTPLIASIFAFLLLVWGLPTFGVMAAAWSSILGVALQTLLLAPGMGKPFLPDLKSPAIQKSWQRIKPLLLGAIYYKTDPLVDRFLLSSAGSGSLSLYYFAQQIYGGVCQVLNKAIAAPLVPVLSKLHKSGELGEFRRLYQNKLAELAIVSLAGLFLMAIIGQSLLGLLAGFGNFSVDKVVDLWWIMLWLGGVLVGGAAGQVCASTFYACGDTVTPTRMSIFTYTVYMPCKVVAFYFFGVKGLAIATSTYYMINLVLQMLLLWKKLK